MSVNTAARRLAKQVQQAPPTGSQVIWGVVQAVNTDPNSVDLTLRGSTVTVPGVKYLASYTPTVADTVMCVRTGSDLVVVHKLA